jgi:hypothetical protein
MPEPTETTRYSIPLQAPGTFGRLRNNAALQKIDDALNDLALMLAQLTKGTNLGNEIYDEVPVGVVAQGNVTFTLAKAPIVGTSTIRCHGGDLVEGVHYTLIGTTHQTLQYVLGFEPYDGETHFIDYTTVQV